MTTKTTTTTYRRTREAAKRKARSERTNREATWDLILAAAADGEDAGLPITGTENVVRVAEVCAEELVTDTGEPLAIATVKNMMIVGRWVHEEATTAEVEVIRTLGWTAAVEASKRGASPSAVTAAVGRGVRTRAGLIKEFRVAGDPDDDAQTSTFSDDAYIDAVSTIAAHHTAEARGEYEPGPTVRLARTLLGQMLIGEVVETDWDAAVAELLSEEA